VVSFSLVRDRSPYPALDMVTTFSSVQWADFQPSISRVQWTLLSIDAGTSYPVISGALFLNSVA
jgi:hypothetical protein